jgi:hypothetical protein
MNFKNKITKLTAKQPSTVIIEYNTEKDDEMLNNLGDHLYDKLHNSTLLRVNDRGIEYYNKEEKEG